MKLLTFNMCMEVGRLNERLDALGVLVREKRPEFITLQTVNNDTLKKIKGSTWGSRYNIIQPPTKFETRGKPSVAILSTYPPESSKVIYYHETKSNRLLLKGYFIMYDKQKGAHVVSLCTTHLEEGREASEIREKQINEALLSLMGDDECFVSGDFSLLHSLDGELHLNGSWMDAWVVANGHTGERGDTYANPLLKEDKYPSGRPDRILFKVRRYKLDSVEVVGKDPARGSGVHISTHFGVLAAFSLLDPTSYLPPGEQTEVACFFERAQWSLSFEQKQ